MKITASTITRLEHYKAKTSAFLVQPNYREKYGKDLVRGSLNTLIPLVAASLIPQVLNAQVPCNTSNGSSATNNDATCGASVTATIDVDGGGVDLIITGFGGGTTFLTVASGMTFGGTKSGAYMYLNAYADGASINAANVTVTPNTTSVNATGTFCGESFNGYGWLDYDAGAGGFDGLGTGVIAFKKDDRLGFIEVTHNDVGNSVTVLSFGIANNTTAVTPTIVAGECSSLPVELALFTGEVANKSVYLNWETTSETHNEGFEVQRSIDGQDFNKIGWIEGAGSSSNTVRYSFLDDNLVPNQTYYYRLNQLDFDGSSRLSGMLSFVYAAEGTTTVQDFVPNPVSGNQVELKIISPQDQLADVCVHDELGRLVSSKKANLIRGLYTMRLDVAKLANGTYFVRVEIPGEKTQYKKLVVSR